MPYKPKVHRPHRPAPTPAKPRPNTTERGYGYHWQRYSRWYLGEHPLCVNYATCGQASREVDHIKPTTGPDDPLHWEPSNHQPMCKSCHSAKTGKDRQAGATRNRRDLTATGKQACEAIQDTDRDDERLW